jgi:hypothetical protein
MNLIRKILFLMGVLCSVPAWAQSGWCTTPIGGAGGAVYCAQTADNLQTIQIVCSDSWKAAVAAPSNGQTGHAKWLYCTHTFGKDTSPVFLEGRFYNPPTDNIGVCSGSCDGKASDEQNWYTVGNGYGNGGIPFPTGAIMAQAPLPPVGSGDSPQTLSFGGSSAGIVYSIQTGSYQVVGDWVFGEGSVFLSNAGTGSGAAALDVPLPIDSSLPNQCSGGGQVTGSYGFTGLTGPLSLTICAPSTMYIMQSNTGGSNPISRSNVTNNMQLNYKYSYRYR